MRIGSSRLQAAVTVLSVAAGVLAVPAALAQEGEPRQAIAGSAGDAGIIWTDPGFAPIADKLIGSWRTVDTVTLAPEAEGDSTPIVMHIAAAPIQGMTDTMYVEVSRADALQAPYYQAIFQLYRGAEMIRLRTYEFRAPDGLNPALVGLWAAPDLFPDIGRSELVARMDLDITPEGDGFRGETPHPYPTARGGAMEMTSELILADGQIRTRDQGFDAMGELVWGSGDDTAYTFRLATPDVEILRWNDGLAAIIFQDGEQGGEVVDGKRVVFDYTGYLASGTSFDSSFKPGGRPLDYIHPGRLIQGWQRGVTGMTVKERRRLIIPPQLGYGGAGNPRAGISGTDTLFFDVDLVALEDGPEAATPAAPQPRPAGQPVPDNADTRINPETGRPNTNSPAPSRISPRQGDDPQR